MSEEDTEWFEFSTLNYTKKDNELFAYYSEINKKLIQHRETGVFVHRSLINLIKDLSVRLSNVFNHSDYWYSESKIARLHGISINRIIKEVDTYVKTGCPLEVKTFIRYSRHTRRIYYEEYKSILGRLIAEKSEELPPPTMGNKTTKKLLLDELEQVLK